jgi:ribosomal protein L17
LRLHEQTHVDVAAKTAEHTNVLLNAEADPGIRNEIIDAAIEIAEDVNEQMDKLLNPGKLGSIEDETALNDWISTTNAINYHSSIETQFAERL